MFIPQKIPSHFTMLLYECPLIFQFILFRRPFMVISIIMIAHHTKLSVPRLDPRKIFDKRFDLLCGRIYKISGKNEEIRLQFIDHLDTFHHWFFQRKGTRVYIRNLNNFQSMKIAGEIFYFQLLTDYLITVYITNHTISHKKKRHCG